MTKAKQDLNPDVVSVIGSFFTPAEVCQRTRVSKAWRQGLLSKSYWQQHGYQDQQAYLDKCQEEFVKYGPSIKSLRDKQQANQSIRIFLFGEDSPAVFRAAFQGMTAQYGVGMDFAMKWIAGFPFMIDLPRTMPSDFNPNQEPFKRLAADITIMIPTDRQDFEEKIKLYNIHAQQKLLFVVNTGGVDPHPAIAGFLDPIQNDDFDAFIAPVVDFINRKAKVLLKNEPQQTTAVTPVTDEPRRCAIM